MGESTDQIKREIAIQRDDLGSHLNELENKAKSLTDWRGYFEKNPMTMIGVAFGGGLLLATMAGGKRSRSRGKSSETYEQGGSSKPSKTLETWENVKGALAGLASGKAVEFLDEAIPGFKEHFGKQQGENSTATIAV
ncbi:MAG: hypothetical protein M3Z09_08820 [Acidobacteriota bacterium]|nr:hypothetical protein [Acidobacteriota bacterium]